MRVFATTLVALLIGCSPVFSQLIYLDSLFAIQTDVDSVYGSAVDFAGNVRELRMDISYPTNDSPPPDGRPLMVIVHGGAFIDGAKDEKIIPVIREDFAHRGYVTAAVNYRLGMFQTHQDRNCNTRIIGLEWNCLNIADSLEWYRGMYRGVQDVNGAVRYLVQHAAQFNIDPQKVFLVGESAGAFIAMGAAYLDDSSEVRWSHVGALPDVLPPNNRYDLDCVKYYDLDTSIASMDLSRPDLGNWEGDLNQSLQVPYTIKAVGDIYGAVFDSIFPAQNGTPPALYMFHQPNDLLVPFNRKRVLAGFDYCSANYLACLWLQNLPQVHGGNSIRSIIDQLGMNGTLVPDYLADFTTNNADCFQQANPSLAGHSMPNYGQVRQTMAQFFYPYVALDVSKDDFANTFHLAPNPVASDGNLRILLPETGADGIQILDLSGKVIVDIDLKGQPQEARVEIGELALENGLYLVQVRQGDRRGTQKLVVMQ